MAVLNDIATRVNEYRTALKSDVDLAATDIENGAFGSGGAFNAEKGFSERPPKVITGTTNLVDKQAIAYSRELQGHLRNRAISSPDDLPTSNLNYTTNVSYDLENYNTGILLDTDKNLSNFIIPNLDEFNAPVWTGGTITPAQIDHIRSIGMTAATQLAAAQEGWDMAQFDMNHAMDLAGASLGARGFRRANSWLKTAQNDIIRKFVDQFYEINKKVASDANNILRDITGQSLELLNKFTSVHMQFNEQYAEAYGIIAKIFYATKGLANDINIEAWQTTRSTDLMKKEALAQKTFTLLQGAASLYVASFKAKQSVTMGEWESEMSRIQQELDIETTNAKLDVEQQKKIYDRAMTRIQAYYSATKGMIALDNSQFEDRIGALKTIFEQYRNMLGSSSSSALGVTTGKG